MRRLGKRQIESMLCSCGHPFDTRVLSWSRANEHQVSFCSDWYEGN